MDFASGARAHALTALLLAAVLAAVAVFTLSALRSTPTAALVAASLLWLGIMALAVIAAGAGALVAATLADASGSEFPQLGGAVYLAGLGSALGILGLGLVTVTRFTGNGAVGGSIVAFVCGGIAGATALLVVAQPALGVRVWMTAGVIAAGVGAWFLWVRPVAWLFVVLALIGLVLTWAPREAPPEPVIQPYY